MNHDVDCSEEWARSIAGDFAMPQSTFGFQVDSTQNQFEHLLNMVIALCIMNSSAVALKQKNNNNSGRHREGPHDRLRWKDALP